MLDLQEQWGALRFAFADSILTLAIDHREDWFEASMFRPATSRRQAERILQELQQVIDLVEELNLNTRIWSKA